MWHPDGLDTFDNYFGASPRFAENRETMWTTTITISHWSIRPTDPSHYNREWLDQLERFSEDRSNGDFPPVGIAKLGFSSSGQPGKNIEPMKPSYIIEERSSSLVVTGDPSGYFWVCSVWSSLTDYDSICSPVQSLPSVLQSFINQQASGRCLVFLILLGHLCEKLALEYATILSRLDTIVELGVSNHCLLYLIPANDTFSLLG